MAGASSFPKTIDTDTQLIRRVATDVLVPADHNNLVDAVESIEQTFGSVDDGTGGGGAQSFNVGLAQIVGMPSTAGPNPRYPWLTVQSQSLYAVNRALPGSWSNGSLAVPSYTTPIGLARWLLTTSTTGLIAETLLPALTPLDVLCRVAYRAGSSNVLQIGFIPASNTGPVDGIAIIGTNIGVDSQAVICIDGSTNSGAPEMTVGFRPFYLLFHFATQLSVYMSRDGVTWGVPCHTFTPSFTYYYFAFNIAQLTTPPACLFVDFVAFGSGLPAGAV